MKEKLSSRERLLLAINNKEPDHVPLDLDFFGPLSGRWKDQFQRAEELLSMEVDDTLRINPPYQGFHPEVKVKTWQEKRPGEEVPLLFKEYETPKGKLSTVVRKTKDWPYGDDIPLISDFNIPRSKKFLISEEEDLEKVPYLFGEPSKSEMERFRQEAKAIKEFGRKHQLLTVGRQIWGGDTAAWLCGLENLIFLAMDRPQFMERLMEFMFAKANKTLELLLDLGVDVVFRRGWYETTDFWSPSLYKRFFAPYLKKEIEMCHQAGIKFAYAMSSGIMPLLSTFKELGIDILYYIDPVQDRTMDLRRLKEEAGGVICLRGGVNSYITVELGSEEDIDAAVKNAISILAPGGGFILSAVDAVGMQPDAWDKVLLMIESWRRHRDFYDEREG